MRICPLCHLPHLNSKAEMDIITHLALCVSQSGCGGTGMGGKKKGGWDKMDRIMVGCYVAASQTQKKWYTKVLGRVMGVWDWCCEFFFFC